MRRPLSFAAANPRGVKLHDWPKRHRQDFPDERGLQPEFRFAGEQRHVHVLPAGWYLQETGTAAAADGKYSAGTGSATAGDIYSFGVAGAHLAPTGRSAPLLSGTNAPLIGASFTNDTGGTISALQIAYTGEEWRLGTAGREPTSSASRSASTRPASPPAPGPRRQRRLDFTSPDLVTTGAKDGNAAGDHTSLSATISVPDIPAGATFWIRWVDSDAGGSDDGLAIDNFSISATTPVQVDHPGAFSIADASVTEGNAGTTPITFTVTRDSDSQRRRLGPLRRQPAGRRGRRRRVRFLVADAQRRPRFRRQRILEDDHAASRRRSLRTKPTRRSP